MRPFAPLPQTSLALLAAIFLLPLVAACGPSLGTVAGKVSVNGQPVASGVISFVPAEGDGSADTVNIVSGAYEVKTTTGMKFVQISAPIVTGQRKEYEGPDAPLVDITEESLPPRFNSQTELTFDVASGPNTKDWDLTVAKKTP